MNLMTHLDQSKTPVFNQIKKRTSNLKLIKIAKNASTLLMIARASVKSIARPRKRINLSPHTKLIFQTLESYSVTPLLEREEGFKTLALLTPVWIAPSSMALAM